jgi:hypothetical protein
MNLWCTVSAVSLIDSQMKLCIMLSSNSMYRNIITCTIVLMLQIQFRTIKCLHFVCTYSSYDGNKTKMCRGNSIVYSHQDVQMYRSGNSKIKLFRVIVISNASRRYEVTWIYCIQCSHVNGGNWQLYLFFRSPGRYWSPLRMEFLMTIIQH